MGSSTAKPNSNSPNKISKELAIRNRLGLHARPSALFVKTANRFRSEIWVEKDGVRVNGKSIMGLMILAAGEGSKLLVSCEGADAELALLEIETIMLRKFDED